MRYIAINLESLPSYHMSGKSVNELPLKHHRRILKDYELFFVTDGELWMEQNETICLKKGELLTHVKEELQWGTKATQTTFYWFHFDGEVQIFNSEEEAKACCERGEKWIFFADHFALKNLDRIILMLTELNHYGFEDKDGLVKSYLTGALLAEIASQYRQSFAPYAEDKRFAEILGWLSLHETEEISVTQLAERFAYNPKYLSMLFRKFTGKTAKAYVIEKKIGLAKRLLQSGTDSVKQVARAVGFSDEYYFMRIFKKEVGMTPKNYRKTFCGCQYS
jgi:AraC-like DNA-binding protein